MRILMINTTSESVISFRQDLINRFKDDNHDIFTIVNDNIREEDIKKLGVSVININQNNRSKNILKLFLYYKNIKKIVRDVKPDVIFSFQVKPNTLGILASRKYCDNIFAMVEGLGDVFIKQNVMWKMIRMMVKQMYRRAFKFTEKVFFLNSDDLSYFVDNKIIESKKTILINGIGINIDKIEFKSIKKFNTFIMVARLLKSKGVIEYCEAAQICKKKGYLFEFLLIGGEAELKKKDIKKYIDTHVIKYIGFTQNVLSYLEESSVFVLPSYREGLPMSVMEAMAVGRAIITTKNPGCKETVIDNLNGYFVLSKDPYDLANKMILLMGDKNKIMDFGANSRKIVEEKFNQRTINNYIFNVIMDNINQ